MMYFRNSLHDGKPETVSGYMCAKRPVEALKHAGTVFFRDSRAVIGHPDEDPGAVLKRGELDPAAFLRVLDRVIGEVCHHHEKRVLHAADREVRRGRGDRDRFFARDRLKIMLHGGEKLPDGDPLERPPRGIRVEPRDREELLNQVRGAGNAFIKPREVLRERLRGCLLYTSPSPRD